MKAGFWIMNIGVAGLPENDARRIRALNVISVIAASVSTAYLIFYLISGAMVPMIINIAAILSYLGTFYLTHRRKYRLARVWIFSAHMAHVAILTLIIYTRHTGFHFYFLSIPALVFLVFEYENMFDKLALSFTAIILFFVCEIVEFPEPLIRLPQMANRILYLTSLLTVFLGLMLVIFLFTRNIKIHEEEQGKLIRELRKALSEVKTLRGFLPICASCKKIRDDKGYWNQIESYIRDRSEAEFSHSICPDCAVKLYPELHLFDEQKKEL
jgi:hypothetical protein